MTHVIPNILINAVLANNLALPLEVDQSSVKALLLGSKVVLGLVGCPLPSVCGPGDLVAAKPWRGCDLGWRGVRRRGCMYRGALL
jgi:hypothetical protein